MMRQLQVITFIALTCLPLAHAMTPEESDELFSQRQLISSAIGAQELAFEREKQLLELETEVLARMEMLGANRTYVSNYNSSSSKSKQTNSQSVEVTNE